MFRVPTSGGGDSIKETLLECNLYRTRFVMVLVVVHGKVVKERQQMIQAIEWHLCWVELRYRVARPGAPVPVEECEECYQTSQPFLFPQPSSQHSFVNGARSRRWAGAIGTDRNGSGGRFFHSIKLSILELQLCASSDASCFAALWKY